MYYAGIDPAGMHIHVARTDAERLKMHHALVTPDRPPRPRPPLTRFDIPAASPGDGFLARMACCSAQRGLTDNITLRFWLREMDSDRTLVFSRESFRICALISLNRA